MVSHILIALAFVMVMIGVGNIFQKCFAGVPLYRSKIVDRLVDRLALILLIGGLVAYLMNV